MHMSVWAVCVFVLVRLCSMTFGTEAGCQTANISRDSLRRTTSLWLHLPVWTSINQAGMCCSVGRRRCLSLNIGSPQRAPLFPSRLRSIEESPVADGQRDEFHHFPPNCSSVCAERTCGTTASVCVCLFHNSHFEQIKRKIQYLLITSWFIIVFTAFLVEKFIQPSLWQPNNYLMDCREVWCRHLCPPPEASGWIIITEAII